jgi:hypothetical protein
MYRFLLVVVIATLGVAETVLAQGGRVPSPPGTASTEVLGKYGAESAYTGGKWIEITSGRPIKRGRDLWGSGADYGKRLNSGAPVWRAGANATTRLKTEVPLVVGQKTVAAGEYSLFIDLKPNRWTLIVSTIPVQATFDPTNTAAGVWGSDGYTDKYDVVRAEMTLGTLPMSIDQLTWNFADMSDAGGKITLMWDKTIASVPFTIAK